MGGKKKVIISGYYGFNNSGDDAILRAIVKDLKNTCSDIEITALSKQPKMTAKDYKVKAVDRFNFISIIREIYNSDMFISGGGSLLQDVTSTRSIIYYLSLIYITKMLKKPVMVYANGIGPIRKKFNRILTKKILDKVDLITLRDFNSKKTVEGLGVTNKNIHVTADPVYTLKPSTENKAMEIYHNEGIPLDKPMVGVSVRDWKNSDNIKEVMSKAIEYFKKHHDVNVVLIPMHYPEDLKISKDIYNETNADCYVISNKYSVEDMMALINKLEMIVAMRLHSLIYAATQAIPMVGLIYDPKVEGLMESLSLESKCHVDKLDIVDLCTIIDEVWNNKIDIKKDLEEIREDYKEKAYKNIDMALELLKSR